MTEHPFHADEPTPPAPPPEPPQVMEDGPLPGDPRCYFCGARFRREADVSKTKHAIGNGYAIYVMICPECRGKKERGEAPFHQPTVSCSGGLIPLVFFAVFAIFIFSDVPGCIVRGSDSGMPTTGTTDDKPCGSTTERETPALKKDARFERDARSTLCYP